MKNYKKYFQSLIVVTLLLTLFYSCSDDDNTSLNIVNPKAQYTFVINDDNPFIIDFTSVITDRDSWVWDFGDGETSTIAHPSHTYAGPGEYIVTLTAIGEPGSTPVEVQQAIIIKLFDPTAEFTTSGSTDNALQIAFNTISAYAKSYAWDFGDGNTSTEKNPTHIYEAQGDYTVTLTVTGLEGTTPVVVTKDVTVGVALEKLTGTIIGHESSWENNPDTYVSAAFDGDLATFVDGNDPEGYAGYDLGEPAMVTLVKFAPREGDFFAGRMVGGEIRGSNDPTILTDLSAATYETLYTITEAPAFELNEVAISAPEAYRFIYYYSAEGHANISELEFYGGGESGGGSGEFAEVSVENSDFSLPANGKQSNWDNVPGWNSDTTASDSGVEEDGDNPGEWFAFKMSSDPSVYNLTGHTITADEQFKVSVEASESWNTSQIVLTLYYDSGDGVRNQLATETFDLVPEETVLFEITGVATTSSVGSNVGIMIETVSTDGGDGWMNFDNVQLFAK